MSRTEGDALASDPVIQALQDSRRRLVQLQRVAGMGLWEWDLRTSEVTASEETYRLFGLEPSGSAEPAQRFWDVLHPDDVPKAQASLTAALAGRGEYNVDLRLVQPDGTLRWVNSVGEAARDEAGNPVTFFGTMLDITHRKQVEEVLRASEQRLRLLQALGDAVHGISDPDQIAPIALRVLGEHLALSRCAFGYVESDGETVVIPHDYTDGCTSLVGRFKRSAFGQTARGTLESGRTFVARDIAQALPAAETSAFDAIDAKAVIACALMRDGAMRALLVVHQTSPRDWSEGEINLVKEFAERCWATIEQRAAETKLRHSETLLRIASRAAHFGGWSIQLPEFTLEWSDEVRAIHELPPGTQPVFDTLINMYAPEFRPVIRMQVSACAQTGEPFDFEAQLATATGRAIWVRAIGQAERDGAGAIVRISGALQDITARRQLEEQFRQAQKMEAVGLLAGGIAHDFNNLLSVILGYSSLIASDLVPGSKLSDDIKEIGRAGECARDLTHRLLAFSRRQVMQPRVCDWNLILNEMERMLQRLIGETLTLTLTLAPDIGQMLADPAQIEHVVMNLVVNARDATPSGGHLTIETSNVEIEAVRAAIEGVKPGRYVMLAVIDTGVGMSAGTRSRVFEPFFSTKEKGKGTGLGLSTVHGIVSQSGGFASVESALGQGSTFRIYLPRVDSFGAVVALQEPLPRRSLRGHETILIVEDEEQVRGVMRAILMRNGYTVLDAQNGGEAFLICEQHIAPIHLMLTDVVMPRMSGRELAERVVKLRPQMKIIYMSGYTEDALGDHGVLEPEIAFLHKPMTSDALLRKVREVLEASGARVRAM